MPRSGASASGHMSSLPSRFHSGTFRNGESHASDPFFPAGFQVPDSLPSSGSDPVDFRSAVEATLHSEDRDSHLVYDIYFKEEEKRKRAGIWTCCCKWSPKLLAVLVVLTVLGIGVVVPLVGTVGEDTMSAEQSLQGGSDTTSDTGSGCGSDCDGSNNPPGADLDRDETESILPILEPEELIVANFHS